MRQLNRPDNAVLEFFLMLDVSGASQSPYAPVIQLWNNGGPYQRWDFHPMPDGSQEIINNNSGQCLTTDGVAGDPVYQYPCNGYINQEWFTNFWVGTPYAYAIKNAWSGLFLDVA